MPRPADGDGDQQGDLTQNPLLDVLSGLIDRIPRPGGGKNVVLTGGAYGVKPPYETLRDLAPIAQLIITPNVLVVSNDVPARNVQELVARMYRTDAEAIQQLRQLETLPADMGWCI